MSRSPPKPFLFCDVSSFNPFKGNSVYSRELLDSLLYTQSISGLRLRVGEKNAKFFESLCRYPNVEVLEAARATRFRNDGWFLTRCPDGAIFHQLGGQQPYIFRSRGIPVVTTVHDCNFLILKAPLHWKLHKLLSTYLTVSRSDRLIFISQFSRDHFQSFGPFRKITARIHNEVIYNGIRHPLLDSSYDKAKPAPPYWVCFGNQLHKRADIALAAVKRFNEETGSYSRLKVVGAHHPPPDSTMDILSALSDGDLEQLLRGARALLFPSEYEGFGLPCLEAMAVGTPVIAHRLAPLEEIGEGAILFSSENTPSAFADHMKNLVFDSSFSDTVSARSRARAQGFTWGRCADQVSALYRDLLLSFQ
jgi:glycosyltransferase involved in cell wall biosynthesis